MRARIALLCLLVVAAGCAAPTSQSAPPPGLSTDGVTDANALVRAHTDALQSQSFTVRSSTTMRPQNGSYRVVSNRTWRVDPDEPIRGRVVSSRHTVGDTPARYAAGPTRTAAWRNGTTTYQRVRRNGTASYRRVPLFDSPVKLNAALQRNTIYRLSTRRNATVEPVDRDGQRLYRVTAALNATAVASNASMTLLVDSNGVVRTIETEQTVRYRSGKREISSTVRIDTLGATTVERPDWYGTAVTTTGNRTAEG
ncbi:DUF7537 family lipoprotein [Haloplanus pelagicus]|jgi:hypothetical protein|uniref:DUF7537 family lipoprotein n=1 Tax=Haloplanus pelagicus TaxID=2949995 RepID=UPI0020422CC6|nr:hypothetical protein [Haloplanus sp. HW8-1]